MIHLVNAPPSVAVRVQRVANEVNSLYEKFTQTPTTDKLGVIQFTMAADVFGADSGKKGVRLFARRTFTTPKIRTFTTPKFGHFPPPKKNICQEDNCHPHFFSSFFGALFLAFSTYSSWRTSRMGRRRCLTRWSWSTSRRGCVTRWSWSTSSRGCVTRWSWSTSRRRKGQLSFMFLFMAACPC